jgi:hypothetical protein
MQQKRVIFTTDRDVCVLISKFEPARRELASVLQNASCLTPATRLLAAGSVYPDDTKQRLTAILVKTKWAGPGLAL